MKKSGADLKFSDSVASPAFRHLSVRSSKLLAIVSVYP